MPAVRGPDLAGGMSDYPEVGIVSSTTRWVICVICAVLGVIAVVYALIYLAVPIHSLPGFVPGKKPVNGHYHKRAALTGVIGIVLIVVAFVVAMTARKPDTSGDDSGGADGGSVSAPVPDTPAAATPAAATPAAATPAAAESASEPTPKAAGTDAGPDGGNEGGGSPERGGA